MNGKLAKQIRKAVNFNPNAAREYRGTNHTERVAPTGRLTPDGKPELTRMALHTAASTGSRATYQTLKASVLAAKRGGDNVGGAFRLYRGRSLGAALGFSREMGR